MSFSKSQWIWNKTTTPDQYVEFCDTFCCQQQGDVFLNLSFDGICNVYVNDQLVFFKQCADYPFYKIYDQVDISQYCKKINELRIEVWYLGQDNAIYYKSDAGLIFEVTQNQQVLLASTDQTPNRLDVCYQNNYCKLITSQLGFSFLYDTTAQPLPFEKSVVVSKSKNLYKNPLRSLQLGKICLGKAISNDANSILLDLGSEQAGFLSLDITSSCAQKITIAYGEHITDGVVRQKIDSRNFSVEVVLSKGNNAYANYFRRLAGRYLQIYFENPLQINQMGILPVTYPVTLQSFVAKTPLQQSIYDICVNTLTLCMHEHYEDCPWREQAFYSMDGRNQMLCGYHAFGEYSYPRHNLVLMSKGLKTNGLLELTYPAQNTPAIPFFSLVYPMAVAEYVSYSGDNTILTEVAPAIKSIMSVFEKHISSNGLIANLPYPFWNFYEWAEGSHNDNEITRQENQPYIQQFDLILNCAYLLALKRCDQLFGTQTDISKMRQAIHDNFFDKSSGLYRATIGKNLFTELGNSLAILSGVCDGEQAKFIANQLVGKNDMVKVTLSMQCFKYDALLYLDKANATYVLDDIQNTYSVMLSSGATTVWETILGQADFDGAGSLCHGWSAMPVYYFHLLTDK